MGTERKFYKSNDKKISGVCGGIGEYFDIDPIVIRVIYLLLSIFSAGFPGLLLYIILALVIPNRPLDEAH